MTITVYGIKNCDTMKKAFKWLNDHDVAYDFHDYKKVGANNIALAHAIDAHGWENVINRRGTTWRKLSDDIKNSMDKNTAIQTANENPSIIKRPMITHGDTIILGFDMDKYEQAFIK
jgi:arsenate reductase